MECIQQDFDEICKQRNQFQDLHDTYAPHMRPPPRTTFGVEKYGQFALKGNAWLKSGIAVVIAPVMIAWLTGSDQVISDSFIGTEKQILASTAPEIPVIGDSAQVLETQPLPATVKINREVSVEKKPRQNSVGGTTNPRDMTLIATTDATTSSAPLRIPDRAVQKVSVSTTLATNNREGSQSSTSKSLHAVDSVDKEDTWIINLVSSSNKADADRFAEMASSRHIKTVQQQVTVNGKQYWRVQITGFSTVVEARVYAVSAKEKMGLKDVWITKR